MSDYTIAVNWSGKDALSDSDAAKVISGSDFNTEFTTARTAINSKADTNGNSSEDFAMNNGTAATQSAGNNTTKIATTAFVTAAVAALDQAAINALVYPVGSIYTTISATAPATLLGMGTWVAFGAGKVPIGINGSDADFDTAEETGGSKTASGTTGSHTLTLNEIPAHTHTIARESGTAGSTQRLAYGQSSTTNNSGSAGGGAGHTHTLSNSIVQPYIVVYMWKRTA